MRVGFGVTVLARGLAAGGVDGIGSYTRELGRQLVRHEDISLNPVSFGFELPTGYFEGVDSTLILPRYPIPALGTAVFKMPFPGTGLLRKKRIDLFHSTDHLVPRLAGIPVLATVMDAIPLSHPQWINQRLRALKAWLWRKSTQWADHIVTISEFSKREIVEHFGVPEERVSVVPLGVAECHFEPISETNRKQVLERHGLPSRFLLFVGTLQPRKNLDRVIQAHAALPHEYRQACPLVVVGRMGWNCDEVLGRLNAMEAAGYARWLKYLPDFEVRALMQSAQALVFPSLCEGFGLPVVEAFAAGLPVITSNTTSLPEVAGDAALLVDPEDIEAIADGMSRILENDDLVSQMRERGLERARELSWPVCAEKTLALYRKLAG